MAEGAVRTIRFSPSTEEVLGEMAAATGTTEAEVIVNALSLSWWAYRELAAGSRLLVQRGDVVTELVISGLERVSEAGRRVEVRFCVELHQDDPGWVFRVPSLSIVGGAPTKEAAIERCAEAIRFALEG